MPLLDDGRNADVDVVLDTQAGEMAGELLAVVGSAGAVGEWE